MMLYYSFMGSASQPETKESKMTTFTIPQKMSNSGSIHDIASDMFEREIVFAPSCKFAVVLASYYGGKGYTTHKTAAAAAAESHKQREYSHTVIDTEGNEYSAYYGDLVAK
jgi:hypothetical protein